LRFPLAGLPIVAAAIAVCSGPSHGADKTPFTVADSIAWTRLIAFDPPYQPSAGRAGVTLFSPDGSQFLVQTRRGDLAGNVNVEQLVLFDAQRVTDYLLSDTAPPRGRLLAEVAVETDAGLLTSVAWLNSREVAFLAEGGNRASQLFIAHTTDATVRQVTRSETAVKSYAVSGPTVLFYAHRRPPAALVRAVDNQTIYRVIAPPNVASQAIELFKASPGSEPAIRVALPAARISPEFQQIWLSPSGRYAVVLAIATSAPAHWAEYQAATDELKYAPGRAVAAPDSLEAQLSRKVRYMLVDVERSTARFLLDAPGGAIAMNGSPREVYWTRDERSVVVTNTYLPLQVDDAQERSRRRAGPAIAEVELSSGAVTPIVWEPAPALRSMERIVDVAWDDSSGTLSVNRSTGSDKVREQWRRARDGWRVLPASADATAARFHLELRQSLNERPKLYATIPNGSSKLLLDPNPGADVLALRNVETLKWTDENRLPWAGGLIYPPGYVEGRRYPFILQTHGFEERQFMLDGLGEGAGTAYAAQALANLGFVVLQAAESPDAITNDVREPSLVAEGWRAIIDQLVARGVVDPRKVGIVAFSRTCLHAIKFLAEYPDRTAAVVLADGPWWGYAQEFLLTNYPPSSVAQARGPTGELPEMERLGDWFRENPLYRLRDTRAAVRIEAMGPGAVVALWETYAVLQNSRRAVDMIYFPEGGHNLLKPVERLGSQGGSVDWFRFWLKEEEDPSPQKSEQYERWRRLRSRQVE
jgi:dipeptidyl aminopeptidase/acylaminoacyl peptidase